MSTKDYIKLAAVVKDASERGGDEVTLLLVAAGMAHVFAEDSPAFKPDVFYEACGFEVGSIAGDDFERGIGIVSYYPLPRKGGA